MADDLSGGRNVAQITGRTRLYGILGDPVHQVKTPQGINRLFEERGFDGVMVPLHVGAQGLETVAKALRELRNLDGLIVTVPHKTAMVALCDELTPAAARVGAVNAVRRTPEGRLRGGILDGEGFVAGLRRGGIEPHGRSVYLAGSGGAACAIAFSLAEAGVARVTVANRTRSKAAALVERLRHNFPALAADVGGRDPSGHELVVNCTSLGMRDDDELPLDADRLDASQVVVEIVMQPAQTALLRAAARRGCRTHPGLAMLECQLELMAAFMGAPEPGAAGGR
jgi:shikimate dehydrogenase